MFLADILYADLSLKWTSVIVGLAYVFGHGFAAAQSETVIRWLKSFSRDKQAGTVLTVMAAAWTLWVMFHVDISNFQNYRPLMVIGAIVVVVLLLKFPPEMLAVRMLGCLLLLAAAPVLQACFLKPFAARLVLVVLAYVWVIAGMFLVGKPFLFRDFVGWITAQRQRFVAASAAGALFGVLLVALGFFVFGR